MKRLILLCACPFILTAQHTPLPESEVPLSVRSSFTKMFPGATAITWEREKYGLYEAELKLNGRPASATFNANGLLQRTEEEVATREMPPAVIEHAQKMFPGFSIAECQMISTPDKRKMYEVEMRKAADRKSLIFDENNNFLRVEVDEDDDDQNADRSRKG